MAKPLWCSDSLLPVEEHMIPKTRIILHVVTYASMIMHTRSYMGLSVHNMRQYSLVAINYLCTHILAYYISINLCIFYAMLRQEGRP